LFFFKVAIKADASPSPCHSRDKVNYEAKESHLGGTYSGIHTLECIEGCIAL